MSQSSASEKVDDHVRNNVNIVERQDEVIAEKRDTFQNSEKSAPYTTDDDHISDDDTNFANKTLTIRKAEYLAQSYKAWYYQVFLLVSAFICGYGYGLDGNIRYIYTGYATSSYAEHSLLSTVNVINAVVSAVSQIVYARLCDVYGRLSLFVVSIILYSMGTIIQCQAYDVQRYAAGAIFYNAGYVGVLLILLIIMSDFSSLRWRLFYQFAPTWPFIINTWISGNITAAADPINKWSWDIGMWAFIFPLSCVPILCCMIHMRWRIRNEPGWVELKNEKTFFQEHGLVISLKDLFWKVDVIGLALMGCSLGCILVPLTLAGGVSSSWNDSRIIGTFVLGWVLIPILVFWEWKYATHPLVPYKLVKDRGVWAAMAISFLIDFIYYMAADYLYTVLIVAVNESVKAATRISSLSSFVSTVGSPFLAFFMSRFTRMKPFIIFGCCLWFVSMGLLYNFRGGDGSQAGIIGALVVWGVGTTLFTYPVTASVQAATSHDNMATVTALNYTLYRIGSAIGAAVSGAIWTQTLYKQLVKRMGDSTLAASAYASPYAFIADYPWGTPVREAMVESYRYVQRLETIVAIVFCAPLVIFSLCLRDAKLTDEVAHNDIAEGEYIAKNDNDPIWDFFVKLCPWGKSKKSDN